MKNIVIGIEGLVGSGKTSICKCLLDKIPNSVLFHMGNLYRAIIYALKSKYKTIENMKENLKNANIKKEMEKLNIQYKVEERETQIYIDGTKTSEEELQSPEISMGVSVISNVVNNKDAFIVVRNMLKGLQSKYNVIASGRAMLDIYPEMDYHFFVIADLEERINRKYIQYNGEVSKEELRNHINKRDELQKDSGFYAKSSRTIILDVTKCKTPEESTNLLLDKINFTQPAMQA